MGSFSSVVRENVTHEIEYQPRSKVDMFYDKWAGLIFYFVKNKFTLYTLFQIQLT